MTDMQQFISTAAGKLGVSETAAGSAAGAILGFVKQRADGGDFAQLLTKIPGAGDVLKEASVTPAPSAGGGMLGGLMGKASSTFGGSGLDLLAALQKTGMSNDKLKSLATMLLDLVKSKAGPDLTNRILAKVPEVQKLLG